MAEAEKKPNFFTRTIARISKYIREMRSELKKVVWPTRKQMVNNTIVVLVFIVLVGACIWIADWIAGLLVQGLISLVG